MSVLKRLIKRLGLPAFYTLFIISCSSLGPDTFLVEEEQKKAPVVPTFIVDHYKSSNSLYDPKKICVQAGYYDDSTPKKEALSQSLKDLSEAHFKIKEFLSVLTKNNVWTCAHLPYKLAGRGFYRSNKNSGYIALKDFTTVNSTLFEEIAHAIQHQKGVFSFKKESFTFGDRAFLVNIYEAAAKVEAARIAWYARDAFPKVWSETPSHLRIKPSYLKNTLQRYPRGFESEKFKNFLILNYLTNNQGVMAVYSNRVLNYIDQPDLLTDEVRLSKSSLLEWLLKWKPPGPLLSQMADVLLSDVRPSILTKELKFLAAYKAALLNRKDLGNGTYEIKTDDPNLKTPHLDIGPYKQEIQKVVFDPDLQRRGEEMLDRIGNLANGAHFYGTRQILYDTSLKNRKFLSYVLSKMYDGGKYEDAYKKLKTHWKGYKMLQSGYRQLSHDLSSFNRFLSTKVLKNGQQVYKLSVIISKALKNIPSLEGRSMSRSYINTYNRDVSPLYGSNQQKQTSTPSVP